MLFRSKIMKLNDCLNEMKLDEKKINTYREKIQKELKIIFRFCLTLLAFIILIIGIMFISYSELEQGNMKDWYTVCNSLVVPLLIVNGMNVILLGIFYHCEKPLNHHIKNIAINITNVSKIIVKEISKLSNMKQQQKQIIQNAKHNLINEALPNYELNTFLKTLERSPKYEMYKILESLERQNIELPKRISEANETTK